MTNKQENNFCGDIQLFKGLLLHFLDVQYDLSLDQLMQLRKEINLQIAYIRQYGHD